MTLHQSRYRLHAGAAGENVLCKRAVVGAQVILQQPLEHGAQIGRRFEIAIFKKIRAFQPRPIGDHPAALERAADE